MRFSLLSFLLFSVASYTNVSFAKPTDTIHDSIVAEVNGEKIYQSGINTIIADFAKAGTVIDDKTKKRLIEKLVDQKLVAQFAKKKGYDTNDSVQKQIQVMTEMVLHDYYFSSLIEQNITPQAIKAEFDTYIKNYKPRFDYKASHILVKTQTQANDIKKRLDNKESFSDLAKQYSTDGNASSGGDLGYFTPEMMVKPFADSLKKLEVGHISEPVKTDFGWHIIYLTDKKLRPQPTLEQLTPKIEHDLARRFISQHTAELKKQSKINFYDVK